MHKYEQKGSLKDGTSEQMSNGPPVKKFFKKKDEQLSGDC
jgi:hypothetical protein